MLRDDLGGAQRADRHSAGADPLAPSTASKKSSDDRSCLENLRPEGAELSRTKNVTSSFHAEPRHYAGAVFRTVEP
jgi:hypothetical protein